ncbi:hypothetical protein SAMN04487970_100744 [Paenibacillus tianmuensis]|uniref:YqzN/YkzM domain-containing protein n=1 Tax=Paenibacillus tianmuensis TaxID=624147 RepID=A0A1G4QH06_9BACL|nr:hypothetical protein [Paenibacillus tianmuensis]SCW43890.1 hypothetical protein SAMN04487970_100744 [Paenibacillus tianmuensis]
MSMYTREELTANALTVFGVSPEVVIGALFGAEEETFSVEEARGRIEQFMNRRVNE